MPQNLLKNIFWKINLIKMMKIFGCDICIDYLKTKLEKKVKFSDITNLKTNVIIGD